MTTETSDYRAIDAVVNIWTKEALAHRPGWGDDFFVDKMNVDGGLMAPQSLEQMIGMLDEAGIERAFLIAAHSGRLNNSSGLFTPVRSPFGFSRDEQGLTAGGLRSGVFRIWKPNAGWLAAAKRRI